MDKIFETSAFLGQYFPMIPSEQSLTHSLLAACEIRLELSHKPQSSSTTL